MSDEVLEDTNADHCEKEALYEREGYYKEAEVIYRMFIDRKVRVMCRANVVIEGVCRSMDGYLNLVIEDAEYRGSTATQMSTCYVRGAYVQHIEVSQ